MDSQRPGKIIALHLNYPSRAAQRGKAPQQPSYFLKPSTSYAPSGSTVERPAGTELLGFEGEIALVIGTTARRVSLDDAWSHVSGVTAEQRLRRLRPAARRRGIEPALQGRRRVHADRPGPDRRALDRSGRAAHPHLAQRRARSGGHHRGAAVPVRAPRRRPQPADHARARRRHPDRHPGRRERRATRRRGRGRGGCPVGTRARRAAAGWSRPSAQGAEPLQEYGAGPRVDDAQRDDAWGSREAAGLRPARMASSTPSSPRSSPRSRPPPSARSCASAATTTSASTGCTRSLPARASSAGRARCGSSPSGPICSPSTAAGTTRRSAPSTRCGRATCWSSMPAASATPERSATSSRSGLSCAARPAW